MRDHSKLFRLKWPFVLVGTIITHVLWISRSRRHCSTNGGAIADQFTTLFKLDPTDRKNALILGISAGFASVLAHRLLGLYLHSKSFYFSKLSFRSVLLSFIVAYIAYSPSNYGKYNIQYIEFRVPILNGTIVWIIPSKVFCLV
jgi:H+/Cl- antiporter ClcA